ncbi:MAG: hypothetical protein Q7S30_03565 [Candidatus Omnitrophota bacterium]|nr:hypothetical protein [Candidatus Omnitrophota bacterium]
MKIEKVMKIVFVISIIMLTNNGLFAECYNEDACFKDYVSNKGENLVVAVNRDTDQVELYWSEANKAWLKPEKEEQLGLQRLYDKKVQLREMQNNLNRMHSETWYTTNQDGASRQGQR